MKNTLLSTLFIIISLASCSVSKEARSYKKAIDGNWQLQTVVTEGIQGKVSIQLFNEEAFNCFIGSSWHFNKNNSLGYYNITANGNECTPVKRDIRWTIYEADGEPKLLQFKRLDQKLNSMDDGSGFRFTIVEINDQKMQLRSSISFENKPAYLVYNFVRN